MTRYSKETRRRFLATSAAATASLFPFASAGRGAEATDVPIGCASREHFWYRPQPKGLFVDSQTDHRAFAYADGEVFLSEDNGNMIIQDGVILASHCAHESKMATGIIVSLDMGKTWTQYDLKEFGKRSPCRFSRKKGEGWHRVDLRSSWVTPGEMMFIKPKQTAPGITR